MNIAACVAPATGVSSGPPQSAAGLGYLSDWARKNFDSTAAKNTYFAQLGEAVLYPDVVAIDKLSDALNPEQVLELLSAVDPTTV